MTSVVNINDVLDGHVSLEIDCVDRLYLNAYVPNLQVGGQVITFLDRAPRHPDPFAGAAREDRQPVPPEVKAFADEQGDPHPAPKKPDRTRWDDRKLDHVRPYLDKAEADGRYGVVAIVQAQEFQWVFSAKTARRTPGVVYFDFMQRRAPGRDLLLLRPRPRVRPRLHQDLHLLPLPGQGLAERPRVGQAPGAQGGIHFTELANGFASCERPGRPPGHLRPLRTGRRPGLLRPLDRVHPDSVHQGRPARRATSGSCRCARSRSPGPWSSTTHGGPGASSNPSSPTTSA